MPYGASAGSDATNDLKIVGFDTATLWMRIR
jgi:hypothetical protein